MKTVFLDRDGTINKDEVGYIKRAEDFHLFPASASAIALLNQAGYRVIVVTNQSGIAREYYTFEQIDAVHARLHELLAKEGAHVDDIFISPYHRKGTLPPYNVDHEDRKPGLGMFRKARGKYEISVSDSWMIGDKYADVLFGRKAGLRTILVETGYGREEFIERRHEWDIQPDYVAKDLLAAVKLILWAEGNQ